MKPIVYLICGVSGSGKSWVCNQLGHQAKYVSFDKTSKEEALGEMLRATIPVLYDPTVQVSTFIKRHADKLDIRPVFILGDLLRVKQQIKDRGGTITKSLYTRWKRMNSLATSLQAPSGTSNEILSYLKKELSGFVEYVVYKATSPSGKVYIGKSNDLVARMAGHKCDALSRNKPWAFSNAIRKYGFENIKFEVIQDNILSFHEASFLETKFIKEFNSLAPVGYNLTEGGEGCQLISDISNNKKLALKAFYASEKGALIKAHLSLKTKAWHLTEEGKVARQKSKTKRASIESRSLTSILNRERYKSQDARNLMSQVMTQNHSNPSLRKYISETTKQAVARTFDVVNSSGEVIGTWANIVDCAKELKMQQAGISAALNGHRPTYKKLKFQWRDHVI